jgi:hypothetical protein
LVLLNASAMTEGTPMHSKLQSTPPPLISLIT